MKFPIVLSSLLATALAAPAVVWKKTNRAEHRFLHSSDDFASADLLESALKESSLSVVFLLGKNEDGSESLTELASSGKLPATSGKYNDADAIYHSVSGLESAGSVIRDITSFTEKKALSISMSELNKKLATPAEVEVDGAGTQKSVSKSEGKRARQLSQANVLVVNVDPKADASEIDRTLSNTIENESVQTVVLTGVRSLSEVKRERYLANVKRHTLMQKEGDRILESRRRRLEDGADAADGQQQNDMSGVYYVHMTPNILAGLLFIGLFTVITFIGISCMGAISGQDVYVNKMPSIGREA